ncbi:hypothetical protein ONZ45_g11596 [Pleurotus djamor]|nr:hypothetical protein ONZ45_g11596 [Pleurotus djamor]
MYEHLSSLFGGPPNPLHWAIYSRWSRAEWGMIVTGNVQVCGNHLTLGRDLVIPKKLTNASLEPFKRLASAMHTSVKSLAIMQLSHSGRQSANVIGGRLDFSRPLAPSAIRVGSSSSTRLSAAIHRLAFRTPKAMCKDDIDYVIDAFVRGARTAIQAGFDGIQLHAAHGYLLSQFLSAKTNLRRDGYSAANGLRLINEIIVQIRHEAPPQFIIGVKINAADYASSATVDHALAHVVGLASSGNVDFIEISGEFMAASQTLSPRQVFFSQFSQEALAALDKAHYDHPRPLVILTGGFSAPSQMYSALQCKHADLLGIGRYSVMFPELPLLLRQQEAKGLPPSTASFGARPLVESNSVARQSGICTWLWNEIAQVKLVGSGVGVAWYTVTLRRMAETEEHQPQSDPRTRNYNDTLQLDMTPLRAVASMWLWLGPNYSDVHTVNLRALMFCLVFLLMGAIAVDTWRRLS